MNRGLSNAGGFDFSVASKLAATGRPALTDTILLIRPFASHNACYVNPFVRGLRSSPRLPYTPLPEPLHPLTRGSAGGQTEAGDIIGSHIKQFDGYTATKLIVAELQPLQVGEVAQLRRYRPAQLVVVEGPTQ